MSKNPVEIDVENKIKINPEIMIIEKLYPIIYDNSIFLFYKDENELINCYEITDKSTVEKAMLNPDKIIEILEELDKWYTIILLNFAWYLMSHSKYESGNRKSNEIFIGKKPLMTYVTATLVQLANEPTVVIKARGKSITRAVDVAQIIVKRMNTLGYRVEKVKLGSDVLTGTEDDKPRNVSTIEVSISRSK
jgi:archaea-specific DNA-binding protein